MEVAVLDQAKEVKILVENIARLEFGDDWQRAILHVDTRWIFADENRDVIVRVSSYTNLELLGEIAVAGLNLTLEEGLIRESSAVVGGADGDWTVVRTWWFTLTDVDQGEPGKYPGATPKGVRIKFVYSNTRTAVAES